MDLNFLAQADTVTLQFEKAKRALESAKADLELAKKSYEEMLAQADERGIPKAKLKKLTEDRVAALFDAGLLDFRDDGAPKPVKVAKPKAPKAAAPKKKQDEEEDRIPTDEELEALIASDEQAAEA